MEHIKVKNILNQMYMYIKWSHKIGHYMHPWCYAYF